MHITKKAVFVLTFLICAAIFAGCGGGGGGIPKSTGTTISGIVAAPDSMSLARTAGRSASANGLYGKSGVSVTIYIIDDTGLQTGNILATATTDELGAYALVIPANISATSTLVVAVGGGNNVMRAIVVSRYPGVKTHINPMSELVVSEILDYGQPLSQYSTEEIASIQQAVETDATNIDLSTEASVSAAKAKLKSNNALNTHLNTGLMTATGSLCGNGTIDGAEICDGEALNNQTCVMQGFDSGILSCKKNCTFETIGCTSMCGDNHAIPGNVCDGTDLKGATCVSQGFDGGTLGCSIICDAFDTTGCFHNAVCGNVSCESSLGENSTTCPVDCGCPSGKILKEDTCITPACTSDANCNDSNAGTMDHCTNAGSWNAACVNSTITVCANSDGFCPAGCNTANDSDCSIQDGNGICEAGENCGNSADCACSSGICCGNTCTTASCANNSACVDTNACTVDVCSNAGTCSSACTHTTISSCTSGDGCCPAGCSLFNDSDCSAHCDNGVTEGSEQCDAGENNGVVCTPPYGGNCSYCGSSCTNISITGNFCGDESIQAVNGEQCDGTSLGGETCISKGFDGGTLSCSSCSFNTSGCTTNPVAQHYVSKWGSIGSGTGQYDNPRGMAVDGSGNVYVVDQNNNRVDVTDANGTHIAYIGPVIAGTTNLSVPEAVCVSKVDGTIAIVEEGGPRVILLNSSQAYLREFGSYGIGNGQFEAARGCAFDSSNDIYVVDDTASPADTINHRIEKFDINGNFLLKWGSKGTGNGQFNNPMGVTVDDQNNIYVSESGGNRIQKFTSDGTFVAKWGCSGSGNGCFSLPSYIGSDSSNYIYVMDFGNNRVQVFENTGAFLYSVGSLGTGNGQFANAVGITVTPASIVYISDWTKDNVQKFTR